MKYSFLITLRKGVVSALIFGLPVLLGLLPTETLNITLGAVIIMVLNFLKHRNS